MKGFLVFCGALSTVVLIGMALPFLENRDRVYEQRFVGALKFAEKSIEAALGGRAGIYEPAIAPGSKPGHWTLSGTVVFRDELDGRTSAPFVVSLQSLCSDPADSTCWQTVELAIGGRVVSSGSAADFPVDTVMEALAREKGDLAETGDQLATPASALRAANGEAGASSSADEAMVALAEGPTEAAVSTENSPTPEGLAEEPVSGPELILFIQDALKKLRYKPGPIDGKLGARTADAIRAYQRDFDLPQDGRPTPALLRHLRSQLGDLGQLSRDPASNGAHPSGQPASG